MTIDEMGDRLRENQRRLYLIARGMMKCEHDALDMVQETAYRACRKAASLRDATAVQAWLTQILINNCRMALRKRGRETACDDLDVLSVPDDTGHVDMRALVEQLPEAYREPVLLKYYGDMSQVEIARVLNLPESTVRHRLKRALEVLRVQLEEGDA